MRHNSIFLMYIKCTFKLEGVHWTVLDWCMFESNLWKSNNRFCSLLWMSAIFENLLMVVELKAVFLFWHSGWNKGSQRHALDSEPLILSFAWANFAIRLHCYSGMPVSPLAYRSEDCARSPVKQSKSEHTVSEAFSDSQNNGTVKLNAMKLYRRFSSMKG